MLLYSTEYQASPTAAPPSGPPFSGAASHLCLHHRGATYRSGGHIWFHITSQHVGELASRLCNWGRSVLERLAQRAQTYAKAYSV